MKLPSITVFIVFVTVLSTVGMVLKEAETCGKLSVELIYGNVCANVSLGFIHLFVSYLPMLDSTQILNYLIHVML